MVAPAAPKSIPVVEFMHTHPNCRCVMVPITRSWTELGFPEVDAAIASGELSAPTQTTPGEDVLRQMPVANQKRILGAGRWAAWRHSSGPSTGLSLRDMVTEQPNTRWGPMVRMRSVRDLMGRLRSGRQPVTDVRTGRYSRDQAEADALADRIERAAYPYRFRPRKAEPPRRPPPPTAPPKAVAPRGALPKRPTTIGPVTKKAREPAPAYGADDRVNHDNEAAVDKRLLPDLAQFAAIHKQTPQRYADTAAANLERKLSPENAAIVYRMGDIGLEDALNSGRIFNVFDKVAAGDPTLTPWDINQERVTTEQVLFGIPTETPGHARPVYGYVLPTGATTDNSTAYRYGSIIVRLKDTVRARTTITGSDSFDFTLNGPQTAVPSPIDAPQVHSFKLKTLAHPPEYDPASPKFGVEHGGASNKYTEAQIHGDVRLTDIAEIVFTDGPPADGLAALLDAKGVPWRVADRGDVLTPAFEKPVVRRKPQVAEEPVVYEASELPTDADGTPESAADLRFKRPSDPIEGRTWDTAVVARRFLAAKLHIRPQESRWTGNIVAAIDHPRGGYMDWDGTLGARPNEMVLIARRIALVSHEIAHSFSRQLSGEYVVSPGWEEGVMMRLEQMYAQDIATEMGFGPIGPEYLRGYQEYTRPLEDIRNHLHMSEEGFYLPLVRKNQHERRAQVLEWLDAEQVTTGRDWAAMALAVRRLDIANPADLQGDTHLDRALRREDQMEPLADLFDRVRVELGQDYRTFYRPMITETRAQLRSRLYNALGDRLTDARTAAADGGIEEQSRLQAILQMRHELTDGVGSIRPVEAYHGLVPENLLAEAIPLAPRRQRTEFETEFARESEADYGNPDEIRIDDASDTHPFFEGISQADLYTEGANRQGEGVHRLTYAPDSTAAWNGSAGLVTYAFRRSRGPTYAAIEGLYQFKAYRRLDGTLLIDASAAKIILWPGADATVRHELLDMARRDGWRMAGTELPEYQPAPARRMVVEDRTDFQWQGAREALRTMLDRPPGAVDSLVRQSDQGVFDYTPIVRAEWRDAGHKLVRYAGEDGRIDAVLHVQPDGGSRLWVRPGAPQVSYASLMYAVARPPTIRGGQEGRPATLGPNVRFTQAFVDWDAMRAALPDVIARMVRSSETADARGVTRRAEADAIYYVWSDGESVEAIFIVDRADPQHPTLYFHGWGMAPDVIVRDIADRLRLDASVIGSGFDAAEAYASWIEQVPGVPEPPDIVSPSYMPPIRSWGNPDLYVTTSAEWNELANATEAPPDTGDPDSFSGDTLPNYRTRYVHYDHDGDLDAILSFHWDPVTHMPSDVEIIFAYWMGEDRFESVRNGLGRDLYAWAAVDGYDDRHPAQPVPDLVLSTRGRVAPLPDQTVGIRGRLSDTMSLTIQSALHLTDQAHGPELTARRVEAWVHPFDGDTGLVVYVHYDAAGTVDGVLELRYRDGQLVPASENPVNYYTVPAEGATAVDIRTALHAAMRQDPPILTEAPATAAYGPLPPVPNRGSLARLPIGRLDDPGFHTTALAWEAAIGTLETNVWGVFPRRTERISSTAGDIAYGTWDHNGDLIAVMSFGTDVYGVPRHLGEIWFDPRVFRSEDTLGRQGIMDGLREAARRDGWYDNVPPMTPTPPPTVTGRRPPVSSAQPTYPMGWIERQSDASSWRYGIDRLADPSRYPNPVAELDVTRPSTPGYAVNADGRTMLYSRDATGAIEAYFISSENTIGATDAPSLYSNATVYVRPGASVRDWRAYFHEFAVALGPTRPDLYPSAVMDVLNSLPPVTLVGSHLALPDFSRVVTWVGDRAEGDYQTGPPGTTAEVFLADGQGARVFAHYNVDTAMADAYLVLVDGLPYSEGIVYIDEAAGLPGDQQTGRYDVARYLREWAAMTAAIPDTVHATVPALQQQVVGRLVSGAVPAVPVRPPAGGRPPGTWPVVTGTGYHAVPRDSEFHSNISEMEQYLPGSSNGPPGEIVFHTWSSGSGVNGAVVLYGPHGGAVVSVWVKMDKSMANTEYVGPQGEVEKVYYTRTHRDFQGLGLNQRAYEWATRNGLNIEHESGRHGLTSQGEQYRNHRISKPLARISLGTSRMRPELGSPVTLDDAIRMRSNRLIAKWTRDLPRELAKLGIPVERAGRLAYQLGYEIKRIWRTDEVLGIYEGGIEPSLRVELDASRILNVEDVDVAGAYTVRKGKQDAVIATIIGKEIVRLGLTPNGRAYIVEGIDPKFYADVVELVEQITPNATFEDHTGTITFSVFDVMDDNYRAKFDSLVQALRRLGTSADLTVHEAHIRWYWHDKRTLDAKRREWYSGPDDATIVATDVARSLVGTPREGAIPRARRKDRGGGGEGPPEGGGGGDGGDLADGGDGGDVPARRTTARVAGRRLVAPPTEETLRVARTDAESVLAQLTTQTGLTNVGWDGRVGWLPDDGRTIAVMGWDGQLLVNPRYFSGTALDAHMVHSLLHEMAHAVVPSTEYDMLNEPVLEEVMAEVIARELWPKVAKMYGFSPDNPSHAYADQVAAFDEFTRFIDVEPLAFYTNLAGLTASERRGFIARLAGARRKEAGYRALVLADELAANITGVPSFARRTVGDRMARYDALAKLIMPGEEGDFWRIIALGSQRHREAGIRAMIENMDATDDHDLAVRIITNLANPAEVLDVIRRRVILQPKGASDDDEATRATAGTHPLAAGSPKRRGVRAGRASDRRVAGRAS